MKKIYLKPAMETMLSGNSEMIASSILTLTDIDQLDVTSDDTETLDIEEGYIKLEELDFEYLL